MTAASRLAIAASVVALAIPRLAAAVVTYMNGNFTIGYLDLSLNGGLELKIERVFNSKSSHDGLFGFGWGSDYETYLQVQGDGSVIIFENGGGAQNRFETPTMSNADVAATVDAMVGAARRRDPPSSTSQISTLRERLQADAFFRQEEWESLVKQGLVAPREVPVGTRLRSTRFGHQELLRVPSGFVRFASGSQQEFDASGQLSRISDSNGNAIFVARDAQGRIGRLTDDRGQWIALEYDGRYISRAIASTGATASYRYQGHLLVWACDSDGEPFWYEYSADNRLNLVAIRYRDGGEMTIGYNHESARETVRFVVEKDGSLETYEYGEPAAGENWTAVRSYDSNGTSISKKKFRFFSAKREGGGLSRLIADVDGEVTDTSYADGGYPVRIVRDGKETTFRYDTRNRVIEKVTPSDRTVLTYAPGLDKVASASVWASGAALDADPLTHVEYAYDVRGNLLRAWEKGGKISGHRVRVWYDDRGRIATTEMSGHNAPKVVLRYSYNDDDRLTRVHSKGVGSIQIEYGPSGDRLGVKQSGPGVANKVTSTMTTLLGLLRPAGVQLSF